MKKQWKIRIIAALHSWHERVVKRLLEFGLGTATLFAAAVALAQDAKAPGTSDKAATATYMSMMAQMGEHMKKMQALHDRMMSAVTLEERQKAIGEARKEMQEGMAMMKPMMQGGGMVGG